MTSTRHARPLRRAALILSLATTVSACSPPAEVAPGDVRGPTAGLSSDVGTPQSRVTLVAVGDIVCAADMEVTDTECQQQATADLVDRRGPDAVVALGDLQYQTGQYDEFRRSWAPGWGQFDDIVAPVPGNHEYETEGAAGYLRYFNTGPYSARDIGAWRFYLLDSNCDQIDCEQQAAWLAADL